MLARRLRDHLGRRDPLAAGGVLDVGGNLRIAGSVGAHCCCGGGFFLVAFAVFTGFFGGVSGSATRSIESNPSPDVYEARARAYRALALEDERRAQELRAASR